MNITATPIYKATARALADANALEAITEDARTAIWTTPEGPDRVQAAKDWFAARRDHDAALKRYFTANRRLIALCAAAGIDYAALTE